MEEIKPQPAPNLNLPRSSATVRVKAIDSTTRMVCNASSFVQPAIEHHELLNLNTMCFLVEHETPSGIDYVLFDCGSRKDYWNSAPKTNALIASALCAQEVDFGVDEILANSGFDLNKLKAMVWSHWHWDHTGDGSKYPSEVDIVVGPGFKSEFVPGWPENPECPVLASDLEGHEIVEPEFDQNIAGFPAHDYFGDGSFYLLDVPGHALGHIGGFARTTEDTFIFMGADCCHYAGALRPTSYLPLPSEIPSEQLDTWYPRPCPCSVFTELHPKSGSKDEHGIDESRTEPFYDIAKGPGTVYSFAEAAQATIEKLRTIDASPDILLCVAHDDALFVTFPLFNKDKDADINNWKQLGYKEQVRWHFLNELPKGDKPGREPIVEGYRQEGGLKFEEGRGFVSAAE